MLNHQDAGEGQCSMRGSCGMKGWSGKMLPCPYDGPALEVRLLGIKSISRCLTMSLTARG